MNKPVIVKEIRDRFFDWNKTYNYSPKRCCYYWALWTHITLKEKGLKSLIAAGSLHWPAVIGNGFVDVFSYQWEPESMATKIKIARDEMPEMHVWVQLPERREIVDLTTRYLPKQCQELSSIKWRAPKPPDFIWCTTTELPKGVVYDRQWSAVKIIEARVKRDFLEEEQ